MLWQVNVLGVMIMTREYVKQMEERGPDLQGHIVNINRCGDVVRVVMCVCVRVCVQYVCVLTATCSMSGHRMSPTTGFNFYTATKYAVTALTEGTRMELRMKKSKIRVTVSAEWAMR